MLFKLLIGDSADRLLIKSLKEKVTQSCLTLCDPMDYRVHGILQDRILEWVAIPFSRASSQPRDQTQVSALQVDSLPVEPQGKPKNTGVGSLSLLQQIFLTQELTQGLLHCRWILFQLSYQESLWVNKQWEPCVYGQNCAPAPSSHPLPNS